MPASPYADLVERLRDMRPRKERFSIAELMDEAADAIEALSKECDEAKAECERIAVFKMGMSPEAKEWAERCIPEIAAAKARGDQGIPVSVFLEKTSGDPRLRSELIKALRETEAALARARGEALEEAAEIVEKFSGYNGPDSIPFLRGRRVAAAIRERKGK